MTQLQQIRVLLVDDSARQRAAVAWMIRRTPGLVLAGEAATGEEAVRLVETLTPDIVLMDCHLPVMDGIAATRAIMHRCPVPIVVTSARPAGADDPAGREALRAGALAVVPRLPDPGCASFDAVMAEVCLALRLMAEVRVVRRHPPRPAPVAGPPGGTIRVIAMGASTGGPQAILQVLRGLGPEIRTPVLVVQHMAAGYLSSFRSWLARASGMPVEVAAPEMPALPGHVYLGPEDRHLGLDARGRLLVSDAPPEHGFRPSISALFRSVTDAVGPGVLAVLLTGMGEDGAAGLAHVASRGGITVIQNRETAAVFGMPGAALRIGAAQRAMAPAEIARFILGQLVGKSPSS